MWKGSIVMSGNGISAYNYNYMYPNYSAYNDDFMAQQVLGNNNQNTSIYSSQGNPQVDTVSFSGKEQKEDEGSGLGTAVVAGGLAIGAFLLGKNWKAVKGYINKFLNGKTAKTAKTALQKAKNRVTGMVTKSKKQSIKGTSVTGVASPITNAQEAKVIQNIDTKHANSASRKLVEQHMDDVVTPKMQAKYDADIAYQPLTPKQKAVKAQLDAKNAAQRAELNSIKNNSRGAEKLESVAQAAAKSEAAAKAIKDGAHLNPANKNIYFTKNGQVTQIRTAVPNSNGEYVITDPKKIAKHLSKHNIKLEEFALGNTATRAA